MDGTRMTLHFEVTEFQERIARITARLSADGLRGLLVFRQESMY
jgi:hypothetical protein